MVLALEAGETLVKRDASTHHPVGEGESVQRNAVDGPTGGTGLASRVERVNGVCCGSSCGFFHVGAAGCLWLWLRNTSATGCGAGVAFRWSGWVRLAYCCIGVRFDVHPILPLLCDSVNRLLCSCPL